MGPKCLKNVSKNPQKLSKNDNKSSKFSISLMSAATLLGPNLVALNFEISPQSGHLGRLTGVTPALNHPPGDVRVQPVLPEGPRAVSPPPPPRRGGRRRRRGRPAAAPAAAHLAAQQHPLPPRDQGGQLRGRARNLVKVSNGSGVNGPVIHPKLSGKLYSKG